MNVNSLKIKIFAALLLVSAVIAGLLLRGKPLVTSDILVKIKYRDSSNLIRVAPYPEEIELKVEGTKENIRRFRRTSCIIDLSNGTKGINKIRVRDSLVLPRGISLKRVAPEYINVQLETRTYKRFPVHVVTQGKPVSGYWLIGSKVEPEYVLLSGPSQNMRSIKKVKTKPIDLSGQRESFRKEVVLELDESIVSRSGKIFATLEIQEKIVIKNVKSIPVTGKNTKYSYKIVPGFVDVEIKGPETLVRLNNLKEKIGVYIDLKGLKKGIYVRRAAISIPLNFTLVKAKPANFTVTIN